jgi:hypothetical protein
MSTKSKNIWLKTEFLHPKDVNEVIFSQPYIKPKIIGTVLRRSSRTTLSKLMEELVAARILTPKIDGSEVYYLNDDLLRILSG